MVKKSVTVLICDRCDYKFHDATPHEQCRWGNIRFVGDFAWSAYQKANWKQGEETPDICPKCLGELYDWWCEPKVEVKS